MIDLWPEDIEQVEGKAPVTILREQASLLGKKTMNIVEAKVRRISNTGGPSDYIGTFPALTPWIHANDFAYAFDIVAPALGDYRYGLFTMAHGVEMYPLKIKIGTEIADEVRPKIATKINDLAFVGDANVLTVQSQDEFLEALKAILNSAKAQRVIKAILAQSTE